MVDFNVYAASKRPYWTVKKNIMPEMNRRFCNHIHNATNYHYLNISIYFNNKKTEITDVNHLTAEVAKRYLENDKRTLDLFEKAISVNNLFTVGNLAGTYKYDVYLGKLLPEHLLKYNLQEKANTFLGTTDINAAIKMLREMDVLKRDYSCPKDKEFEKYLDGARYYKVQLKFGRLTIDNLEELSRKIEDRELKYQGLTLRLFLKSIDVTAVLASDNYERPYKFSLDLAFLMPLYLKRNGVKDRYIEDLIESSDHKKFIEFIYRICALDIENKNRKPEETKYLIRILPDLFYPE
jgi:hypothetical protein